MKKLITTTVLTSTLLVSQASASDILFDLEFQNTGLDLVYSDADFTAKNDYTLAGKSSDDSALGAAIHYGATFKVKDSKFTVTPELYYELTNVEANDVDGSTDKLKIKNRKGANLKFGYKLSNYTPYIGVGIANADYEVDWASLSRKNSSSETSMTYTFGTKYHLNNKAFISLELGYQELELDSPSPYTAKYDADLTTIKTGISYKF